MKLLGGRNRTSLCKKKDGNNIKTTMMGKFEKKGNKKLGKYEFLREEEERVVDTKINNKRREEKPLKIKFLEDNHHHHLLKTYTHNKKKLPIHINKKSTRELLEKNRKRRI